MIKLMLIVLMAVLVSASEPIGTHAPTPLYATSQVQACHYEAEITGTHTWPDGSTALVPIGRIVVTTCSSPDDLARRVEQLTTNVRRQATAQAASPLSNTR
jgi:hypothetical protein